MGTSDEKEGSRERNPWSLFFLKNVYYKRHAYIFKHLKLMNREFKADSEGQEGDKPKQESGQ